MLTLGIDLGSSSVKVVVFDTDTGKTVASAQQPEEEMKISAPQAGWAEQDPDLWWQMLLKAMDTIRSAAKTNLQDVQAIGIAYQMHGLVTVDQDQQIVRPSIIWCDSRAVAIGEQADQELSEAFIQTCLLNSPGNFTASKLKWVQANEPEKYERIAKMMLPGDFIAMKLTGEINTTATGLSEGVLWNFKTGTVASEVLDNFDITQELVPGIVPVFGEQGRLTEKAAERMGLKIGIPVTYRAGDQPNNAFSLNVLEPGAMAATAGTSAVIYGVSEENVIDEHYRVNTFLHVNNTVEEPRNGVLLCVNGSGILYQWLRRLLSTGSAKNVDYEYMNALAATVVPGSAGLKLYPFGNGAERILKNALSSGTITGLDFNTHGAAHMVRGANEGIVYALKFGFDIMRETGVGGDVVRAGRANLFLSPVFREIFVNTNDIRLELYDTNGAEGAARGAAVGIGYYATAEEAFENLECLLEVEPDRQLVSTYGELYEEWKENL